jgi:uncharacterized RDD family membrane protein YckC
MVFSSSTAEQPAGLWRRFASLAYESLLLFGLVFIAGYLFVSLARDAQTGMLRIIFQIYLLTVCGAYFVFCWTRTGQTLAMKTWGLRIRNLDGSKLDPERALLRYLIAVPSVGTGLGLLWALVDQDKQFLHDRLARTRIVVNDKDEGGRMKDEGTDTPEKSLQPDP